MDRDYPDRPFVGVGGVIWKDDKVLLVRRDKTPRMGEWSIPGGAQHIGETLEAAVLREVKEETGLTVSIAGLVDVVDGIFLDAEGKVKNHYTLVDYSVTWQSGNAQALDDIAEVRWTTLDELGGYGLWDETERIIRKSAWSPRLARKERSSKRADSRRQA